MIKQIFTMAVLVCSMAGKMYANNNGNQVFNPQPESARILQEQMHPQTSISEWEVQIPINFTITMFGETYRVEGAIYIGNERAHFVEVELDVYDADGNLHCHIQSTYSESGERTELIVTNPWGEILDDMQPEIHAIMEEVDEIVINSLSSL